MEANICEEFWQKVYEINNRIWITAKFPKHIGCWELYHSTKSYHIQGTYHSLLELIEECKKLNCRNIEIGYNGNYFELKEIKKSIIGIKRSIILSDIYIEPALYHE
ncbi:MAG: hypothetical protein J7K26_00055 [Candidatus Aenigmarchaeota archaeon]|nr:hypothetical protein [Candidatus Aenigmarchaeota archaeon]